MDCFFLFCLLFFSSLQKNWNLKPNEKWAQAINYFVFLRFHSDLFCASGQSSGRTSTEPGFWLVISITTVQQHSIERHQCRTKLNKSLLLRSIIPIHIHFDIGMLFNVLIGFTQPNETAFDGKFCCLSILILRLTHQAILNGTNDCFSSRFAFFLFTE